jgi:hypothetical protein
MQFAAPSLEAPWHSESFPSSSLRPSIVIVIVVGINFNFPAVFVRSVQLTVPLGVDCKIVYQEKP